MGGWGGPGGKSTLSAKSLKYIELRSLGATKEQLCLQQLGNK